VGFRFEDRREATLTGGRSECLSPMIAAGILMIGTGVAS